MTKAKYNRSSYVSCWIHSLINVGKKPIIELIEECDNWIEKEQYYINLYPNLCNHSIGGESGTLGYKMTKEHKIKISNKLLGRNRSEKTKLKISNGHKNKVLKESTKEKLRIINTGKIQSIETRMKKSKIVQQYNLNNELLNEWVSLGIIQETTGWLKSNISSCCHGRLKTAYGYKWLFKNEDIV